VSKEKKKQALSDERIRNAICQKVWGLRKRRFSLAPVMAKLDNTSQTAIAMAFLVMNLSTLLRRVFLCVFMQLGENNTWFWVDDHQKL
jgi:transposase, IS5 family